MFNKFPKRSGIYHIKDNIEELEIQIQFRHINSLLKLPQYHINSKGFTFNSKEDTNVENDEEDVILVQIKWQQKLLAPHEVELYKDYNNCHTEIQKKYHKWLKDTNTKSNRRKSRKTAKKSTNFIRNEIFTYVDEDQFMPENDTYTTTRKDIEVMYVYAALTPPAQLLTLKWHQKEHLLHIYPDFNDFQTMPYFIEIDKDYKHLYAYGCKNISKKDQNLTNLLVNNLTLPQLPPILHWTQRESDKELRAQFDMPPKRMQRFIFLMEISAVCGFSYVKTIYEPLHVRYHLQLPDNCLLEEGILTGATHSSQATTNSDCGRGSGKCHHFGYIFQLTLLCEEAFDEKDMLHLYFELISIDNWERERIEGYTHYATYFSTGNEMLELQCLRPCDSFLNSLKRYFIGGRQKFNYKEFFTAESELLLHSRFQTEMQNTGHVHFKCQRIKQRNCELLKPCKIPNGGMTLDDILSAYVQARHRLQALVLEENIK